MITSKLYFYFCREQNVDRPITTTRTTTTTTERRTTSTTQSPLPEDDIKVKPFPLPAEDQRHEEGNEQPNEPDEDEDDRVSDTKDDSEDDSKNSDTEVDDEEETTATEVSTAMVRAATTLMPTEDSTDGKTLELEGNDSTTQTMYRR